MESLIKHHLSEDEILNCFTHKWLEDINSRTIKNLGKTPEKVEAELIAFIKKKNIQTNYPEKLAQFIILLWIRHKQAIDMIKNTEFKEERKRLKNEIKKARKFIERISVTKETCTLPCMLDLDLKIAFDYDGLIKANQEYIEYLELALQQCFRRGTSPISTDNLQELVMYTMFYIGGELLNLKKIGKPSPLFAFIKILLNIQEDSNTATLGEEKISDYYKRYCENIEESLKHPTITGNKLNINYSVTAYQDGWLFQKQNGNETEKYFLPDETSKGVTSLLNFIYKRKIPDHEITRGIFDIEIIYDIINLTT